MCCTCAHADTRAHTRDTHTQTHFDTHAHEDANAHIFESKCAHAYTHTHRCMIGQTHTLTNIQHNQAHTPSAGGPGEGSRGRRVDRLWAPPTSLAPCGSPGPLPPPPATCPSAWVPPDGDGTHTAQHTHTYTHTHTQAVRAYSITRRCRQKHMVLPRMLARAGIC